MKPTTINRGDVFWLLSEGPNSPPYSHPHVVLQDDVFNHSRISSVVVCSLTSNLQLAKDPGNVLLDEGEAGLTKRSVVVASDISAVAKERLGARIGSLSESRVAEVLTALRFVESFSRR